MDQSSNLFVYFSSLKIGRLSMESPDLVKNIMRGVYRTIPHIIGADLNPSDLRQITIKTNKIKFYLPNFVKMMKSVDDIIFASHPP